MDNREFKDNVKTAADYLAQHGVEVSHTRLLEAITRAFGERNWSTLSAQLKAAGKPAAKEVPEWTPGHGPMSEAQYVAHGGNRCPFCGSTNITADGINADGPNTWDDNTCDDCGSTWSSAYSLTGYFNAKAGASLPEAPRSEMCKRIVSQLTDRHVIVLCDLADDECMWEGRIYSAKRVVEALCSYHRDESAYAHVTTPELFFGEFVHGDERQSCQDLWFHKVNPLEVLEKFDEPSAREAALDMAGRDYVLVLPVNEDMVQQLVDDVKERAEQFEFSHTGYENALNLVRESAEVLNLDATEREMQVAAERLR